MKEENKKRKKEDDDYQTCKYKKTDFQQSSSQPKSNKTSSNLSHFPMSERQQYALLKQMEDDTFTYFPKETTENSSNMVCHTSEGLSYSISTTVATSSLLSNLIGSDKKLHKRNGAGETMLIQMAKKGDLSAIKSLIADGANINEQDYAGWTALHECSSRNYPHIVNYLLQHGADFNCCGLQGDTALHDAVKNNCPEVVKLLLKYGADPWKRNDKGLRSIDLHQTDEIKKLLSDTINAAKEKKYKHRESSDTSIRQEHSNEQAKVSAHGDQAKNYKPQTGSSSDSFSVEDQSSTTTHTITSDRNESKESTKDPYAFEDEEMTEKSSFSLSPHKISPNKSNRHKNHGNGSGSQNEEVSNPKDSRHLSSPNQCGSHNSSPKVPPLRIRINGHSGADRQASEDSQPPSLDEHQMTCSKTKNSSVDKPNFSDSESSLVSMDLCVSKSNTESQKIVKSPEIEIKEETTTKEEPTVWNTGETSSFDEERKSVKEECCSIKDESKLTSTLVKRNNGRTLRSHTAAAQKGKDDEDNVNRAPIKKRKFKSRADSSSGEKNSTSSNCSSNAVDVTAGIIQASTSNISKVSESSTKNVLTLEINQEIANAHSISNNKILMSPNKNEMWDNPYQKALTLNQQISTLAFNLEVVHSKPPVGFQDFLLKTKQYLLANHIPKTNTIKKRSVPPDLKKPELICLFQEHEEVRYNQALKHQSEREQLRINAELEVIRAQNTAARQLAGQDRPFSFFSVTAYKNFTYIPESAIKSYDQNKSQNVNNENDKFSPNEFIKFLKSIKTKFDIEKKKILTRHLHESESLMMVQRMDWELKLKEMILEDIHGDSSLRRMSVEHVPMTEVPNDFILFTTDPFQISGCILT